jgi:hypothetical protein
MFLSRLASQDWEMAGSKLSCGPECGGWGSSGSTRENMRLHITFFQCREKDFLPMSYPIQ